MALITYYEILGVRQDEPESAIIKAFQHCATLCAPDTVGYDQTKLPIKHYPISKDDYFKMICEAIEVLSDVNRRVHYHNGTLYKVYKFDGDCQKIYQKFLHQPDVDLKALETNLPLVFTLVVSLEELFNGKTQQVQYLRMVDINGSYQIRPVKLDIPIEPYMRHNGSFTMPGYGHLQGDLTVIIHLKMHDIFTTNGDDLMCNITVPLSTALLGAPLDITTIDKKSLKMYVRPISSTLHPLQRRFIGEGLKTPTGRGNLIVNISVTLPNVPKDMRKKVASILQEVEKKKNQK